MADIVARYGLNDSEFVEGLRRVERATERHSQHMESSYMRAGRKIAKAAVGPLGAGLGVWGISRWTIGAVRDYAEVNDQTAAALDRASASYQRFRQGIGSGVSTFLEATDAMGKFARALDELERRRAWNVNALADWISGTPGQGAAYDAARKIQQQQSSWLDVAVPWLQSAREVKDELAGGTAADRTRAVMLRQERMKRLEKQTNDLQKVNPNISENDPKYRQEVERIEQAYQKRIAELDAIDKRQADQRMARAFMRRFGVGVDVVDRLGRSAVDTAGSLLGPLRAVGQRTEWDKIRDTDAARMRVEKDRLEFELAGEQIMLRRLRGDERGAELAQRRLDLERRIADIKEKLGDTPEARAIIERFRSVEDQIQEQMSGASALRSAAGTRFPVSAPAGLGAFVALGTTTETAVQGIGRAVTQIERHLQRIAQMTGGAVLA